MKPRPFLILFQSIGPWLITMMVGGLLLAASPLPPAAPPSTSTSIPAAPLSTLVGTAEKLMYQEAWAEAAIAWSMVEKADPTLAGAAYNRGVAEYRAGNMEEAADAFRRAGKIGDADLSARAMYNEGTARYADAVKRLASENGQARSNPLNQDEDPPTDPIKDAMEQVGRSLDHFRDAIDADPRNQDARANAELAHRLLRQLQELQESQENQENQENQEKKENQESQESQDDSTDQSSDGEQEQQQSPPDGEQQPSQDQQQQPESQESEDESDRESEDDQEGGEPDQQPSEADESQPSEESQAGNQGNDVPDEEKAAGEATGEERMSREEAERLLQSVRDKERQRRKAQAEAESESNDRRPPVRKDW